MNWSRQIRQRMLGMLIGILAASVPLAHAQPEPVAKPKLYDQRYQADLAVFTIIPDQGIESVRGFGTGSVSGGGRVGLGVYDRDRRFTVNVSGRLAEQGFSVEVSIDPQDGMTNALHQTLDLTSLQPQSLELAKDDDDRIYQLNVTPTVRRIALPRPFIAEELHLDRFTFQQSSVLLNDQDYLGQMGMSAGNVAFIDVPGLAKVEFSLLPLKVAKPEGSLRDGVLQIQHSDGTLLRIDNVLNGVERKVLPGGPYEVWVRWLQPSMTVEEYREALQSQLEVLRERAAKNDPDVLRAMVSRVERAAKSGRILSLSCGLRAARAGELQE